jgi:hypothetical protein
MACFVARGVNYFFRLTHGLQVTVSSPILQEPEEVMSDRRAGF